MSGAADGGGPPALAVIVIARDEAERLPSVFAALPRGADVERVLVDGGSTDDTVRLAREAGLEVLASPPGRARQLALGVRATRAPTLLFLHGDTVLPPDARTAIARALERPAVVGGAFSLGLEGAGPVLRALAALSTWRSRVFARPYGDQAIFVRRRALEAIGGVPELPFMEDVELARRLAAEGRLVVLRERVVSASERWRRHGLVRVTLANRAAATAFAAGWRPEAIRTLHRRILGPARVRPPARISRGGMDFASRPRASGDGPDEAGPEAPRPLRHAAEAPKAMPILLFLLALFLPRVTLFLLWLFGDGYLGRAFDTLIWPILGFVFLPLTTLAWAFVVNAAGAVEGVWYGLIAVAVLIDIMGFGLFKRRD